MPSLVFSRKGNNRCNVYFEARVRECLGEEGKLYVCCILRFGKGQRPSTKRISLLVYEEKRHTEEISKNS